MPDTFGMRCRTKGENVAMQVGGLVVGVSSPRTNSIFSRRRIEEAITRTGAETPYKEKKIISSTLTCVNKNSCSW